MAARDELLAAATLLPGAGTLLHVHRRELPQRDELCGPFWGLLALRTTGIEHEPEVLDQDTLALAAGTVLSPPPRDGSLPPGESGRDDFRLTLPQAAGPAEAGTSATGVARAIEQLSAGNLAVVPARGEWEQDRLRRLLHSVSELETPTIVLANITTAELADQNTAPDTLERYLDTGTDAAPASRWEAGHFVALVGHLDGRSGCLLLVADSYPGLGRDGLHLQPVERVAAALRRNGLPPGGVLLVVPGRSRQRVREVVAAAGLRTELWDNGSPDAAAGDRGAPP